MIGTRVRRAALAATLLFLIGSSPAVAATDQWLNQLNTVVPLPPGVPKSLPGPYEPATCNPSAVELDWGYFFEGVPTAVQFFPPEPIFGSGIAWVDYFGIPVAVSPPFTVPPPSYLPGRTIVIPPSVWALPSPSSLLPGQYTVHVLLQGNRSSLAYFLGQGDSVFSFIADFLFTTLSTTATIDPTLPIGCPTTVVAPVASAVRAATRMPSRTVLARRLRALRDTSAEWFGHSFSPRGKYPKARICGRTICFQARAGAAWKPMRNNQR